MTIEIGKPICRVLFDATGLPGAPAPGSIAGGVLHLPPSASPPPPAPSSDFSIASSAPNSVAAGQTIVVQSTVTNNGSSPGAGIFLFNVPAGFTFQSASGPSGSLTAAQLSAGAPTGTLAVGGTAVFSVTLVATTIGAYTIPGGSVSVTLPNVDPNTGNNTAASMPVNVTSNVANLAADLQGPGSVSLGNPVGIFTLVTNTGPAALPPGGSISIGGGANFVPNSGPLVWQNPQNGATAGSGSYPNGLLGALPPGASIEVIALGTYSATGISSQTVSLAVPAGFSDSNLANNVDTQNVVVVTSSDITLALAPGFPTTAVSGQPVSLSFDIGNNGVSPTTVTLGGFSNFLSSGSWVPTAVSWSNATGGAVAGSTTVPPAPWSGNEIDTGLMPPNSSIRVTLTGIINFTGTVVETVGAGPMTGTDPVTNNDDVSFAIAVSAPTGGTLYQWITHTPAVGAQLASFVDPYGTGNNGLPHTAPSQVNAINSIWNGWTAVSWNASRDEAILHAGNGHNNGTQQWAFKLRKVAGVWGWSRLFDVLPTPTVDQPYDAATGRPVARHGLDTHLFFQGRHTSEGLEATAINSNNYVDAFMFNAGATAYEAVGVVPSLPTPPGFTVSPSNYWLADSAFKALKQQALKVALALGQTTLWKTNSNTTPYSVATANFYISTSNGPLLELADTTKIGKIVMSGGVYTTQVQTIQLSPANPGTLVSPVGLPADVPLITVTGSPAALAAWQQLKRPCTPDFDVVSGSNFFYNWETGEILELTSSFVVNLLPISGLAYVVQTPGSTVTGYRPQLRPVNITPYGGYTSWAVDRRGSELYGLITCNDQEGTVSEIRIL